MLSHVCCHNSPKPEARHLVRPASAFLTWFSWSVRTCHLAEGNSCREHWIARSSALGTVCLLPSSRPYKIQWTITANPQPARSQRHTSIAPGQIDHGEVVRAMLLGEDLAGIASEQGTTLTSWLKVLNAKMVAESAQTAAVIVDTGTTTGDEAIYISRLFLFLQ